VVYASSAGEERSGKTRLQIVQSGFGGSAAWTAVVDAWRDASDALALLPGPALARLGRAVLASLRGAVRAPALSPALRPAPARP
jgi:hypothetical protein